MYKNKKILAIIPARGGSKGLPRKNIKIFNGEPLIVRTIEQAKKSKYLDDIFVTTDDEEIANIAKISGTNIPFLRPKGLATDTASSVDVVNHVLSFYENQNIHFEYLILLEPTSPLRKKDDIDNIISLAIEKKDVDGVISVGKIHLEHPMIVKKTNENGVLVPYIENIKKVNQRQEMDIAFFPYGVGYLIKTSVFKEKQSFYTNKILPYTIERWQNYEIDDIIDFEIIEMLFNKYLK